MWFALAVGYLKRHNLLKNAMWQLLVVTIGVSYGTCAPDGMDGR